jgi:radical SAM superfamily enzyme YgiQ (UPF0313 family)
MELGFKTPDGSTFFVNIKPNAISLALNEVDVCTFDRAGRLVSAVFDDHTYRRGLDNRVLEKWRTGSGPRSTRCRRWISPGETGALIGKVQRGVRSALSALETGDARFDKHPERESVQAARAELCRIHRFDAAFLNAEASRIAEIYRPVTILPPDQYLALVLQATEGCRYNLCTFCSFYRDRPFRVKNLPEFRAHVSQIREFLGEGVTLRRSVFLADANALCIARDSLLPLLDFVNVQLPHLPIYSFVDAFSDRARTERHFRELGERNVRRLYLGVETGCHELLRFLRKPQTPEDVRQTVVAIKAGGLNVGIIVMLGIGGQTFSERHISESTDLLNSLPWSEGDVLFLSQFVEFPNLEYRELALKAGLEPLPPNRMRGQYEAIRARVRRAKGYPRIAPYNAEEFIY